MFESSACSDLIPFGLSIPRVVLSAAWRLMLSGIDSVHAWATCRRNKDPCFQEDEVAGKTQNSWVPTLLLYINERVTISKDERRKNGANSSSVIGPQVGYVPGASWLSLRGRPIRPKIHQIV